MPAVPATPAVVAVVHAAGAAVQPAWTMELGSARCRPPVQLSAVAAAVLPFAALPSLHFCHSSHCPAPAHALPADSPACCSPICCLQGKLLTSDSFPGQDRTKICLASKVGSAGQCCALQTAIRRGGWSALSGELHKQLQPPSRPANHRLATCACVCGTCGPAGAPGRGAGHPSLQLPGQPGCQVGGPQGVRTVN